MKATIDAIAQRLTDERGMVYGYLAHDGLAGEEGTFLLCTFWLAQAQALAGDVEAVAAAGRHLKPARQPVVPDGGDAYRAGYWTGPVCPLR
ncbi:MAG TPA: hypothetical protein VG253_10790 [Streptosporangiaceae bacterium]|nr:hypothetical protein [Streptosporangiaceae bacterium]